MSRTLYIFSSDIERDAAFASDDASDLLSGICGVGLIDAGIGTVRLISKHAPDAIVYVGTCGAYASSGRSIGDIVVGTSVCIGSGDVASRSMRIPSLLGHDIACDEAFARTLVAGPDIHAARVCCTLGVTETIDLADSISLGTSADVENLEAFAVCRAAGSLPMAVVLGVTNHVGPSGGREWTSNHASMMRSLYERICQSHQR
jgi:nucleoside phosphorylase